MPPHPDILVVPVGVTSVFARCYGCGASGCSGGGGNFFGNGGGGGEFAAAVFPVTPGETLICQWDDGPGVALYPSGGQDGPACYITRGVTKLIQALGGGSFPGGLGGTGGIGDYLQDGQTGQPFGDVGGSHDGGKGGDGAPSEGGPGGPGGLAPHGAGQSGSQPSGGGGGGSTPDGGPNPSGGAGTPSGIRVWDNTNGTASGPGNIPPTGGLGIIFEAGGLPPAPPVTTGVKSAFVM